MEDFASHTVIEFAAPGDYAKLWRKHGAAFQVSPYPSLVVAAAVIALAGEAMGITPYYLGKLIGVSQPNQVYTWLSGAKRPSALYLTRLLRLLLLDYQVIPVVQIDRVDWDAGELILKSSHQQVEERALRAFKR